MSKLPNAPLIEVIFEINWDIINKEDIVNFQYLHGDLYSSLKEKYPLRENLLPPEVPFEIVKGIPVYRFRDENEYPLIQVGPGILTYNTINELYFWDKFEKDIVDLTKTFSTVFPKINQKESFLTLTYLDFFEIDFDKVNIINFINDHLKININQDIIDNNKTKDINLTISYVIDENKLNLNLKNGSLNNQKNGIILQTKLISSKKIFSLKEQREWLNTAHEICSDIFKKITRENRMVHKIN
jgi:uncharacterized protein (TIGR04255 family)